MFTLFEKDPDFGGFALDCYAYPTSRWRIPFSAPLPGLDELAEGLRSFLDVRHGSRKKVTIIAHSLGGLIARQYVISELKAGGEPRVQQLALCAVPNSGSMLASVGDMISFRHKQLKDLAKDSARLQVMNAEWETLNVEDNIRVQYILAGVDEAVSPSSGLPYHGRQNRATLINFNHRSITQAADHNDIRYATLKRFVKESASQTESTIGKSILPFRAPDPLFDIYESQNEPYYLERPIDLTVKSAMSSGNIWLSGASGVGKTSALRRIAILNGWHLNHFSLAPFQCETAEDVLRALATEISNATNMPKAPSQHTSEADLSAHIREALKQCPDDLIIANVIEEMPLSSEQLICVSDQIFSLFQMLQADPTLHGRVLFALSSLHNIAEEPGIRAKVRENIQFLSMGVWPDSDLLRLVELLAPTTKRDLTGAQMEQIVRGAAGSPRFVKMLFRHWRNNTAQSTSLEDLIDQVRREQVQ